MPRAARDARKKPLGRASRFLPCVIISALTCLSMSLLPRRPIQLSLLACVVCVINARTRGAPRATMGNLSAKVTNVTNVNPEKSIETGAHAAPEKAAAGMPLRGVAMVLIAVAVMLGLWGLYSLSYGSSDKESSSASPDATMSAPVEGSAAATPSGQAGPSEESKDAAGDSRPAEEAPVAEEQAPAAAPGNGNAERDPKDIKVAVLNNSGEAGKANFEADRLKGDGFNIGYVGNLPGDLRTVPKTTVFFPSGDGAAESLAREVAAVYQADVAPIEGKFPSEATADNGIIVALAIPQA